jgi:hypothetical protein
MVIPPNLAKYYVKFKVSPEFGAGLSNLSYRIRELKQIINMMNSSRQNKAELRKELYESLISLRLNADKFKGMMPSHEVEMLEKKLREINQFAKKYVEEKKIDVFPDIKSEMPKQFRPKRAFQQSAVQVPVKSPSMLDNALDSEKQELDLLRQDLEDITKELQKKERFSRLHGK